MADKPEVSKREALLFHEVNRGKIGVLSHTPLNDQKDLSLAYTPGVAEPCREIHKDPSKARDYTAKANLVAVVTDGTAVLGLGDIGPLAAMPVMEGKCQLFKAFAGVDAFPICLDTKDTDSIIETVKNIAPTFGGINLEDISAPRCFEIEARLKQEADIPVFHDDQHGTAVVVLAALINTLRLTGRESGGLKVTMCGAGAAGIAIYKMLKSYGIKDIIMLDSYGIISTARKFRNPAKQAVAEDAGNPFENTHSEYETRENAARDLEKCLEDRDVFIGVSKKGLVSREMVESMNPDPIIFALANPDPEILPDEARSAGAHVVATGRSDYPNQINNVLGFPGIFRGALDCNATHINYEMKMAAAKAIADLVGDRLSPEKIIPSPLDERVAPSVAEAVVRAAIETGVNGNQITPQAVKSRTMCLVQANKELMKAYVENGTTRQCNIYLDDDWDH